MKGKWWLLTGLMVLLGGVLDQAQLLLVGLFLVLTGGISYLWARFCLANVSYRRHFGAIRLFHGEETDLTVEIVNAKPLPLAWLITVDDLPSDVELLTGATYRSVHARRRILVNSLALRWYERVRRRYRLRAVRRGAWTFGPVQLSAGDIFGFSIKRRYYREVQTLVVYPKIVPLTQLGLPDNHPLGDFKSMQRVIEDPLRVMGARDYASGDSFRHIHWKATARQRHLQTKIFEPSASRPVAIFLNTRTTEFANEGIDREILELAITAVASIAYWTWEAGHPLGLYVNSVLRSSRKRVRIQPSSDPHQLHQILEALAWMEDEGQWTLTTLLKSEAGLLRYGTSIVVVTALLSDRLLQTLLDLRRRAYGVTLLAVGAARLDKNLPGVQYYHLGSHETWHALETLELAG